jgi:hypothetical protein
MLESFVCVLLEALLDTRHVSVVTTGYPRHDYPRGWDWISYLRLASLLCVGAGGKRFCSTEIVVKPCRQSIQQVLMTQLVPSMWGF